jgi:hypothetical protein
MATKKIQRNLGFTPGPHPVYVGDRLREAVPDETLQALIKQHLHLCEERGGPGFTQFPALVGEGEAARQTEILIGSEWLDDAHTILGTVAAWREEWREVTKTDPPPARPISEAFKGPLPPIVIDGTKGGA